MGPRKVFKPGQVYEKLKSGSKKSIRKYLRYNRHPFKVAFIPIPQTYVLIDHILDILEGNTLLTKFSAK